MFQRLLVAIDETAAGEVEVSFATALARRSGATVHVVHANVFLVGGRGTTYETEAEAARIVDRAVAQFRAAGVEATGEALLATCFNLAPRLADAAVDSRADAIVLGSHRHRRLTRLFGRGVRERIMRVTALPVLTAPSPLKLGRRTAGSAEVRRLLDVPEANLPTP